MNAIENEVKNQDLMEQGYIILVVELNPRMEHMSGSDNIEAVALVDHR